MAVVAEHVPVLFEGALSQPPHAVLGAEWLESCRAEQDLGVLDLGMLSLCVPRWPRRNAGLYQHQCEQQEVIVPWCLALVGPHLKPCVQIWASHYQRKTLE